MKAHVDAVRLSGHVVDRRSGISPPSAINSQTNPRITLDYPNNWISLQIATDGASATLRN